MLFLYYPPCTTCKRAAAWLEAHGLPYTPRHIKEQNPSYEELKRWYEISSLPLKRFFNTSGLPYKALGLKDRLPTMTEEEQAAYEAACAEFLRKKDLYNLHYNIWTQRYHAR